MNGRPFGYLAFALLLLTAAPAVLAADPPAAYRDHCAACHGEARLGGLGPALIPENLARLRKAEAEKVIREGRPATQMLGVGDKLSADEIKALVDYVYTPIKPMPVWGASEITASRLVLEAKPLPDKPVFKADPLNLFVVVESGDHHVSILDGDKLEPIHRFQSRFALHGGPKFTPDGRYVFFASRDGWITKFDLWNLKVVAEVRAGINTRNAAVSGDGKWVAVANYLPHSLVILDADLNLKKILPVTDKDGKTSSRVSAVYDAAPRHSFVVALKDVKEVWEVSYNPKADAIPAGMIHDFKYQEGAFIPGFLNPQRTQLDDYLDDFYFTQGYDEVMGASRNDARAAVSGQVVNLDARRKIADLQLPGMPHLGSGISWTWKDEVGQSRAVMATPNLNEGVISIIDMQTWQTIKQIKTRGPGFFMRSHENSRYAWTDSMMSKDFKDTMQIIDKEKLEIVAELKPAPGKTFAHVEFTRDGKYVLASLWEMDGALIIYDAVTLSEVKRLPMKKPVGKYNVWNKISKSEGTSH
ncbi:nitrite reductase [Dechloromonas sp. HYN0024]|uniref:nitrite reductase n=1 Tax=Dechloromonas sp. HYN0024 TaxID=2231055 RepID=UPI000E42E419|nr:nitrite reductase [Dechloromonas sp. HYN0024]AXS80606.1 cytochrome C oxidase Cbb3 [Dechloromonas sp. HYN0024]